MKNIFNFYKKKNIETILNGNLNSELYHLFHTPLGELNIQNTSKIELDIDIVLDRQLFSGMCREIDKQLFEELNNKNI